MPWALSKQSMMVALVLLSPAAPVSAAHPGIATLDSFCSEANCADGAEPAGLVAGRAGKLYGITNIGGAANDGVVFELARRHKADYTYSLLYSFCALANCADGSRPNASLILDKASDLYGTTNEGGAQGKGEVFELAAEKGRWSLRVLYSFCAQAGCADGSLPAAGLAYAGQIAGKPYDGSSPLFGTTNAGGSKLDGGVAYQLEPVRGAWSESVLHEFCGGQSCSDGSNVIAPLIEDASGHLFGTTQQGGGANAGTVYELSREHGSWSETLLHQFCAGRGVDCSGGALPGGGLAMDAKGRLIGVTNEGGVNCLDRDHTGGCGVIYRIVPRGAASGYSALCALGQNDSADGANPLGTPLLDAKGNIYGIAAFGGANRSGTVFKLEGTRFKVLYTFCAESGCTDGAEPSSLVRARRGTLFGTTETGGGAAQGTAFSLGPR